MATTAGIDHMAARFANAYPRMAESLLKLSSLEEWTVALNSFSDAQLDRSVSNVIAESRYAPSIAEVVGACRSTVGRDDASRTASDDDDKARDLRHAWDDYDVRRRAGQRGMMSPSGDIA